MNDKVVEISNKDRKLLVCLVCREHWHGVRLKCPKCTSTSVIEDQIHFVPDKHNVYTCTCNRNPYFKIARHPKWGVYFKCVMCGKKHEPKDIDL